MSSSDLGVLLVSSSGLWGFGALCGRFAPTNGQWCLQEEDWFLPVIPHSLNHTFYHSLIHRLRHLLTGYITHSFTGCVTCSQATALTHSQVTSLTHSTKGFVTDSLTGSVRQSQTASETHRLTYSLTSSATYTWLTYRSVDLPSKIWTAWLTVFRRSLSCVHKHASMQVNNLMLWNYIVFAFHIHRY